MKKETFEKYDEILHTVWNEDANGPFVESLSAMDNFSWLCEKDPSLTYKAKLSSLIARHKNGWIPGEKECSCPVCKGHVRVPGYNDVFTLYPELKKQWSKSNTDDPSTLSFDKKVKWVCPTSGGKWDATVNQRIRNGKDNGFKSVFETGKRVLPGFNDIATTHPEVPQWWDYEKNEKTPQEITSYHHGKVWWIDENGNSYQMSPEKKCERGQGSPFDAGKQVAPGKSFGDLRPDLAKQWNYEKNGDISPYDITPKSSRKFWWICPETGQTWQATPKYRYAQGHSKSPYMTNRMIIPGVNDLRTKFPEIADELSCENDFSASEVSPHSSFIATWECSKCGHTWDSTISNRTNHKSGCPKCFASSMVSKAEKSLRDYIVSLVGEDAVTSSNRSIISPYELDIYLPEKNLAIEFNGLYWHTESQGKGKNYHHTKWSMCRDKGIQLITVWEDDWRDKRDIVESMIAHKLGVSNSRRVFARNTSIHRLEPSVAREFLDSYHLQGSSRSTAYFGLYDNDRKLVAVSSWRKNKDILYLDRYATSCTVVGGMGKLLEKGKEFARKNGCTRIVTFADHQVSDGGLYESLGFANDGEVSPDYKYLVGLTRKHKFGYRINKFKTDPNLLYQHGMTESQLAQLNGLERIWDCGKTRYTMDV